MLLIEKSEFVCTHCGERYEYALNYEIREANFGRSWLLYEFNLTDENLTTGFEPDGTIYVRIPLTEIQSRAKFVYVVRNNADGTHTTVPARIENGYMIIEADHFSAFFPSLASPRARKQIPTTSAMIAAISRVGPTYVSEAANRSALQLLVALIKTAAAR